MDQSLTGSPSIRFRSRLKSFLASAAVVAAACTIYGLAPYNQEDLHSLFGSAALSFTGLDFLVAGAGAYILALAGYHLLSREEGASKSIRFFRVVAAFVRSPAALLRTRLSPEDRLAVLATLLKVFFGPLMAMSLMAFCVSAIGNGLGIVTEVASLEDFRRVFDQHGFWFLLRVILFVDVLVFTLGYLVELPQLGNRIRSVDPTLLGWTAALLCYPPFNQVAGAVLGSQVSDFPQFDNATVHLILNVALLLLMAVYSWASVALGFKASNLTHRGIVTHGPYAIVRHPAYACKNLAWWIGAIPLVSAAFSNSAVDGLQSMASVGGWSLLYVLRAVTEEDHLRSVDDHYANYSRMVRYRFVPGLV